MACSGCKQRQAILSRTIHSVRAGQFQHARKDVQEFGASLRSDAQDRALKLQARIEDAMLRRLGMQKR